MTEQKSFLRLSLNDPIFILNDDHTSYTESSVDAISLDNERSVFIKTKSGETYLVRDDQSDQIFLSELDFPNIKRKRFELELSKLLKEFKLIPKEIIDDLKS